MVDDLTAILDGLDIEMRDGYELYCSVIMDTWESFEGNDGQMVIVQTHILNAVASHCRDAKDQWPYGYGPNQYRDAIYEGFDPDVIDRAFSETIEDSYSELYEIFDECRGIEWEHDYIIAAAGGSTFGPHSTEANWT